MIDSVDFHVVRNAPPAVAAYLADVAAACRNSSGSVVSLIAFGSVVTAGYESAISDVDLIAVVADSTVDSERERVRNVISGLESQHRLVKHRPSGRGRLGQALKRFADRTSDNERTFFVCTRADLLSGEPQRILSLQWPQARLVDGAVIPVIVASATTVWGEDLLGDVPIHAIGRVDVAKSLFALFTQGAFAAAVYVIFPDVTKYAMDALKRAIHHCYYCHNKQSAPLRVEVAYFEGRYGSRAAFTELLALRQAYRPSLRFVVGCVSTILELHVRTLLVARFPVHAGAQARTRGAS